MATVTWDSGQTSKGQASEVSYTYNNSNFATQLADIPPYAIINSVKITAKFQVNLYTNYGTLKIGGTEVANTGNTNNHDWVTIVNNLDITSYLTGKSGTENAGALPDITVYASKRSGFVRTFKTQVTITWDYTVPTYTVTTNVNDPLGGTLSGGGVYSHGDYVTVKATPNTGWRQVCCIYKNGVDTGIITSITEQVTADVTYSVVFEKYIFAITANVNNAEGGTVSGGGSRQKGETAHLVATPNTGWTVADWLENGVSTGYRTTEYVTLPVTEDATYTVVFEKIKYNVTLEVKDGGVVSGLNVGINKIEYGTVVTLTAQPYDGYRFYGFRPTFFPDEGYRGEQSLPNEDQFDNPLSFTVKGDLAIYVFFEKLPEFTSVEMKYLDKQISETNKVICGEGFIISVEVT